MYLLLDVGGTKTRISVSVEGRTLAPPLIIPTCADANKGIEEIRQHAQALTKGERVQRVVAGFAGTFDRDRTRLLHATNIRGWEEIPLKEKLTSAFGVPVELENDSALAALGEAVFGAGVGERIVGYVTVSTGVGGARVTDGRIDPTVYGFEPGYQIINAGKGICVACKKNHLGAHISGASIAEHQGRAGEHIDDPMVWEDITRMLALGLANTIVHWSPDIMVLGGSVMGRIDLERLRNYLQETLTIYPELPRMSRAVLGDTAGLWGALALLEQKINLP